jgi:uncharacterized protein
LIQGGPEVDRPAYCLITGASRGLGKHFAYALAARKRNVVLVARSLDQLESLANELSSLHAVQAQPLGFDLSGPLAGQRLAEELRERDLSIDLLVNNAGFGVRGEFWKLSLDHQLEMLRLHHAGLVELTFHLLPSMIAERRGAIINVSSTAAFQPIPYAAAYAASKAFATSFSLALAEELRPYGVTVVTVCPGRLRPDSPIDNGAKPRRAFMGVEQSREQVVTEALKALDSHGGLVIPGMINKSVAFAERLIPRSVIAKLVARLSRPAPAS